MRTPLPLVSLRSTLSLALGALAFAPAAEAFVTVGPDGAFSTIQDGVNAAIANGGDEVRVEYCVALCMRDERVDFTTSVNVLLSGGWAADFQSQIPDYTTHLIGNGDDAPTISAIVQGDAIVSINRFALDGTGNSGSGSSGFYTRGLLVGARDNANVVVADNIIYGNVVYTSTTSAPQGGAGLAVQASGAATIALAGNTIDTNELLGTDSAPSFGAGAFVQTTQSGHIDFVLNTIYNNITSNPNGGACRGGGVFTDSEDTSSMQQRGNVYYGNQQFACGNGATGDAEEINATGNGVVLVLDATWTANNTANDPGVYEVFMQTTASSQVLAENGLITHGTWGGLFANSIDSSSITIENYTIADNPVLGLRGIGAGTSFWNTLVWNNGGDQPDLEGGATEAFSLFGVDPLFVDPANGNYRLSFGSPAIDAGTNSPGGGLRDIDLDGNVRPYNGTTDIGAYEYQGSAPNDRIFADGFDG